MFLHNKLTNPRENICFCATSLHNLRKTNVCAHKGCRKASRPHETKLSEDSRSDRESLPSLLADSESERNATPIAATTVARPRLKHGREIDTSSWHMPVCVARPVPEKEYAGDSPKAKLARAAMDKE